ncbi:hypothetical protein BT96DRAFT_336057 [Gymnopus androsaceus JB14]|uniref:Uncharacterized protein n=1 Tax=Gymnopus androsaceus JB14 TaxID=1447944 RepID=A0A6A4GY36_9AGAR|nr:hypothetical protein BT96DRAFT_336057 [Gymnopus androsaceus JB14]
MKHDGNPPRLAFVPCAEICTYLLSKLKEDPDSVVDQIISELRVGNGTRVETRRAYAFLDLYQVISFPSQVAGEKDVLATRHYPRLSKYNPSSKNIVLDSTGNLRIFDSAADSLAKALRDFIFIEQPRVDGTKDGSKLYFHLPETSLGAFLTITAHYYLHLPKPENCEPAFIELMSYMASQERTLSSRKQVGGNKKQNKQNKKRRKTPTEQPRMKRKKLDDEDSDDDNNDEPSSKRRQTKTGKIRGKKPADANTTEKKGTRSSSGNDQRSGIKRNYGKHVEKSFWVST